jgi:hypothetical protein
MVDCEQTVAGIHIFLYLSTRRGVYTLSLKHIEDCFPAASRPWQDGGRRPREAAVIEARNGHATRSRQASENGPAGRTHNPDLDVVG